MGSIRGYVSRYANWNSLKTFLRYPGPVLQRGFRDFFGQDEKKVAGFLGVGQGIIERYYEDLYKEREFFKGLVCAQEILEQPNIRGGLMEKREAAVIYAISRFLGGENSIETGVGSGLSTSHILLALEKNQKGGLSSIELPNTNGWTGDPCQILPLGKQPGWMIPERLKSRWTLLLGDSRLELPKLINQKKDEIDLFLHDSLHTYEHMFWELEIVWPHLRSGGVVIADDADSNRAVQDFSAKVGKTPFFMFGLGLIRK